MDHNSSLDRNTAVYNNTHAQPFTKQQNGFEAILDKQNLRVVHEIKTNSLDKQQNKGKIVNSDTNTRSSFLVKHDDHQHGPFYMVLKYITGPQEERIRKCEVHNMAALSSKCIVVQQEQNHETQSMTVAPVQRKLPIPQMFFSGPNYILYSHDPAIMMVRNQEYSQHTNCLCGLHIESNANDAAREPYDIF